MFLAIFSETDVWISPTVTILSFFNLVIFEFVLEASI
jgi:hypothetical protein